MSRHVRFFAVLVTLLSLVQPAGAAPVLAAAGDTTADRVLGQTLFTTAIPGTSSSQFNSSGAMAVAVDRASGRLFVSDSSSHRILSWPSVTGFSNGAAADVVLGQENSSEKMPNRGFGPTDKSLNAPRGMAVDKSSRLFVADSANNRIMVFAAPFTTGQSAVFVIGQSDFMTAAPNRFQAMPSADSLKGPSGIAFQEDGHMWVVDRENHRVLFFANWGIYGGPALLVLGQPNFTSALQAVSRTRFTDPYDVAVSPAGDRVFVTDYGANRVLRFDNPFDDDVDGMADQVYGQPDYLSSTANNGGIVTATTLFGPSSVTLDAFDRIYVSDFGNNRVLRYSATPAAIQVFGQSNAFGTNAPGTSDIGLNKPDGMAVDGAGNLLVADSANFRLLTFDQPAPSGSPAVSALTPRTIGAGSPAATLNVYGSGFTTSSAVRIGGAARPTTYRGQSWLQAQLTAADIATTGATLPISVVNPAPGGASTTLTVTTYTRAAFDSFADAVAGQPDFTTSTFNQGIDGIRIGEPSTIAIDQRTGRLYATDSAWRVLIWPSGAAYVNSQDADLVLGVSSAYVAGPSDDRPPDKWGFIRPLGLAVDQAGNLWVADSPNNRVLRFDSPQSTGMAASIVLGQLSFTTRLATAGERGMTSPRGLAVDSAGRLAVVDQGNNRVLIFDAPFFTGQAASIVLGQPDFITGTDGDTAQRLRGPAEVTFDHNRRLFVSDALNFRVLGLDYPQSTNQAATLVLGQPDFTSHSSGLGADKIGAASALQLDSNGSLYLADRTRSRVLVYKTPFTNGMTPTFVIGQPDLTSFGGGTSAAKLNFPNGLALDSSRNLFVAEQFNHRIVRFDTPITTPPPVLTSLVPSSVYRGADVVLSLKGSDFVLTSKVLWNGAERPTTFVDGNTLTVAIPASDVATVGTANVSVMSPLPGGGTAGPLVVTIVVPVFGVLLPAALVQAQIQ